MALQPLSPDAIFIRGSFECDFRGPGRARRAADGGGTVDGASVSLGLAFWAGVVSFLSPCTLPLFPSYLAYISGVSLRPHGSALAVPAALRLRALLHALCFCGGLCVLFVMLGWGATAVGQWLLAYRQWVRLAGGVLIIAMGLFMARVVQIPWLMQERRLPVAGLRRFGYAGSALVGITFAAGWTPCIGPVLASVLTLIVSHPEWGIRLMLTYALGFSLPFLFLAVSLASVRRLTPYTERIARFGGWLLVATGVLVVTGRLADITVWLQRITGYQGV
ncbi:MAG: cytochrome c biogenesis protein CcdA [Alicyclobacillaceae bacterium]|nr:cytochrome c biogenesis protein CcdA [Alicyclobacillaceae bacterium]